MLAGDSGAIRQHGITDGGRSWFANLLTAGAIGVATYDTIQAVKLAQKEKDLADKYYNISKDWLDYYNSTFKEPEDEELKEAKDIEYVEPEYDVARGRARAVAWAAFKGQLVCQGVRRCADFIFIHFQRSGKTGDFHTLSGSEQDRLDGSFYVSYVFCLTDIHLYGIGKIVHIKPSFLMRWRIL